MASRFYLTTAIDYSNGDPHLGHVLEKVGADCIARYRRMRGDDVHYLMGMDEHSQSALAAAAKAGVTPLEWVTRMSDLFRGYWKQLGCSNDDWIRTTEPRHIRSVTAFLKRVQERNPGDLFRAEYEGLYCTGCEEFKTQAQIVNGRCIEHPTLELIRIKEPNHYFRLSAYRDRLLELIQSGSLDVEPAIRRNEVLSLLRSGLQDVSISRLRLPWGIPFPGDAEQTVYVWFDALTNYLTATGFPDEGYQRLWPADLHIVGKGISRFHCVLWPAMLLAAGLELPRTVWVHGYVHWEGQKMSKTAGTVVSVPTAIERHGPDALRYFLLREIGFENDGNFTWERFDARYTDELANGYGNLASRVLAMIERYLGGTVPGGEETPLDAEGDTRIRAYREAMDHHQLHLGAQEMWGLVSRANQFVEETAPWNLAKAKDAEGVHRALGALARALARITLLIQPFIPAKAQEVWAGMGLPGTAASARWDLLQTPPVAGLTVKKLPPLFPKPVVDV